MAENPTEIMEIFASDDLTRCAWSAAQDAELDAVVGPERRGQCDLLVHRGDRGLPTGPNCHRRRRSASSSIKALRAEAYFGRVEGEHQAVLVAGAQVLIERERFYDSIAAKRPAPVGLLKYDAPPCSRSNSSSPLG